MTCGHCVSSIRREVGAIPGVTEVDVQLAGGKVTVESAGEIASERFREAVEEAGYELAEPEHVNLLDGGCCGGSDCACGH